MKIHIDYTKSEDAILKVNSAKYLSDYAMRIRFSDDTEKLVDFKPFLTKSIHPSIKKYLNEKYFTNFTITDGNLNWNDYDLIFPIWDLYNGDINT